MVIESTTNNSNCYYSWNDSESICVKNWSGHLGSIETTDEWNEIINIMNNINNSNCWIGANDIDNETHWKWIDNSLWNDQLLNQFWQERNPSINSRLNCGLIAATSTGTNLIEYDCNDQSTINCFVCMTRITTTTSTTTLLPSSMPTYGPTFSPTFSPTYSPTNLPSYAPTYSPTYSPTHSPSHTPSDSPTYSPTDVPTTFPTFRPTLRPTKSPSISPTSLPTKIPSENPTKIPTALPSKWPSVSPSMIPTLTPTVTNYSESQIVLMDCGNGVSDSNSDSDTNIENKCNVPNWNSSCYASESMYSTIDCIECLSMIDIEQIGNSYSMILNSDKFINTSIDESCNCYDFNHGILNKQTDRFLNISFNFLNQSLTFDTLNLGYSNIYFSTINIENDNSWKIIANIQLLSNLHSSCSLYFYVNKGVFLGIVTLNVVQIQFSLIFEQTLTQNVTLIDASNVTSTNDDWENIFTQWLESYFNSLFSEKNANTNVTIASSPTTSSTSRRLLQNGGDDDELETQVDVIIIGDSNDDANEIVDDLSDEDNDDWQDDIISIASNLTGSDVTISNITFAVTALVESNPTIIDDDDTDDTIVDEFIDKINNLKQWQITLIVICTFICFLFIFVIAFWCRPRKERSKYYLTNTNINNNTTRTTRRVPTTSTTSVRDITTGQYGGTIIGETGHYQTHPTEMDTLIGTRIYKSFIVKQNSTTTTTTTTASPRIGNINAVENIADAADKTVIVDYNSDEDDMTSISTTKGGSPAIASPAAPAARRLTLSLRKDSTDSPVFADHTPLVHTSYSDSNYNNNNNNNNTGSSFNSPSETNTLLKLSKMVSVTTNDDIDDYLPKFLNILKDNDCVSIVSYDDLEILQLIGKGNFGQVYKGKWIEDTVAIKQFNDIDKNTKNNNKLKKEIYSEIILACSLPYHPNIINIIGLVTQNKHPQLLVIMPYMEGGNVENYVYNKKNNSNLNSNENKNGNENSNERTATMREKWIILLKSASGLKFLHNYNLVHRDIAARNILIGKFDRLYGIKMDTDIKISDFGMTRILEPSKNVGSKSISDTKTDIGPIKWMAPESIKKKQYSKESDVYMFAITMYEILSGIEPYSDNENVKNLDVLSLVIKIVHENCRPINENSTKISIPAQLTQLITKSWSHDPNQRPNMNQIYKSLQILKDDVYVAFKR